MKECEERVVRVGLTRDPKEIFDEVETIVAAMIRDGWKLENSCIEENLGNIHLFFERDYSDVNC